MNGAPGAVGPLTPYDYTPPYVVRAGRVSLVINLTSNTLARCVITFSPRSMRCAR